MRRRRPFSRRTRDQVLRLGTRAVVVPVEGASPRRLETLVPEPFERRTNMPIHVVSGSRRSTIAASCGTNPAKIADRRMNRHGFNTIRNAPNRRPPNTSFTGLSRAIGRKIAPEASLAMIEASCNGCFAHHSTTVSATSETPGMERIVSISGLAPEPPSVAAAGFAFANMAWRKRSRDASIRSSADITMSAAGDASTTAVEGRGSVTARTGVGAPEFRTALTMRPRLHAAGTSRH